MSKRYTVEDYVPYVGKQGADNRNLRALPNAQPIEAEKLLNDMAAFGHMWTPVWGYALSDGRPQWTQFFLTTYMGTMDGSGIAVTYGYGKPILRKFAICKHEKVDGPGANHERGWHPGKCKHCNFDMSYDSGD